MNIKMSNTPTKIYIIISLEFGKKKFMYKNEKFIYLFVEFFFLKFQINFNNNNKNSN